MTGYESKRAMARNKLIELTQKAAEFIAAEERKVGTRYGYVPKLHPSEYMDEQPAQGAAAQPDPITKALLDIHRQDLAAWAKAVWEVRADDGIKEKNT